MTRNAVITIFAVAGFYNTKVALPILSRINYCHALLYGASASSIQK